MQLRLNIPTATDQLTGRQLKFISMLFTMKQTETDFLVKAFLFLSGLKLYISAKPEGDANWFRHKSLKKHVLIDTDMLCEMAKRCAFLLSPGEVKPLRWIRFARARHYRLYNATFDEYLMAENFYFAYLETKLPEHLDNLIAVLYRLPWHRYNAAKIQTRARYFVAAKPEVKQTVFIWYVGFRHYITKRCPQLFSGKKSSQAFNARNYINGMIHQLSNGDITIKEKLLQQPCWDALDELEQRAIEADSIKNEK